MKKPLLILCFLVSLSGMAQAQCTPVSCISTLPAYGGICDSVIANGRVNQPYSDFISFHVTNACVDAGLLDPNNAGIGIRITSIHSFVFADLPLGLGGVTNAPSYTPNANGCASVFGTPLEAGVFTGTVTFLVNANAWLFSATCGGIFPPIAQNDNPLSGDLQLTILPDVNFTGLDNNYCETDTDAVLIPTGTLGGTFTGPGINGNTFSPSAAGVGTHTITYTVTAQEGAAIAPATDSLSVTVTVSAATNIFYADTDGDGFGDPLSFIMDCAAPAGYVADSTDCDDSSNTIYPGAPEIPDNGIDEDCDGFDLTTGLVSHHLGGMNIYPNPGTNYLYVKTGVEVHNLNVKVYSVYGALMQHNRISSTKEIAAIDVAGLSSGIYFIAITHNEVNILMKWVKQ